MKTIARSRGGAAPRGRRGLVFLLVLAFVAVVVLGLSASSARAASRYQVVECFPRTGVTSGNDLIVAGNYNQSTFRFGEDCANSSNVGFEKGIVFHAESLDPGPLRGTAEFDAPPGTYFDSGNLRADIGARNTSCDPGNCWYAAVYVGTSGAAPVNWIGQAASPYATGFSFNSVQCGRSCAKIWETMACDNFCWHDASMNGQDWYYDFVAMRDLNLFLVDELGPTIALSGSLFDSQIAHGTPRLQIDATDVGSGVRTATVDVNGTRVATPATNCPYMPPGAAYATAFRPCGNLSTVVPLDTTKTPWQDGANTLRVCVADVATGSGSPNTVCEQRTVSVDNSCPDSQGASGQASAISAGLENPATGQLTPTRAVRSTEGAALKGQLAGAGGAPARAASVCIYEAVDEPAGIEQLVQVAKSSSTGAFGVEVPAGPSRTFRAAYRYNNTQIESPSMYLDSSVVPTLELSRAKLRNGKAVGFRGHLPGPDNAARGVTMQARVGRKWRSFKQLVTDARGDFAGKYRFTQTRGHVSYVFRALVKRQSGYPYSEGASVNRKVVVKG